MLSGTLNIDDNAIAGESKKADSDDEIDVFGVHWLVKQKDFSREGSGLTQGRAQVGSFTFNKYCDAGTPYLALSAMKGTTWPTVTFKAKKSSGDEIIDYLTVEMSNCIVSKFEMSHEGHQEDHDLIVEQVAVSFDKVKIVYTLQEEDGSKKDLDPVEYDVKAGSS